MLLGAVVLALTGAEALYADMGHFGRPAIRRAWFSMVMPALTLCYFGQGALLLRDPEAIRNPFFLMAPDWGLAPLVALATVATVVASQAVISGAYSVTRQAVQLGFWPRMQILHTSAVEKGQIYLPQVNALLLCAVLVLVLVFRNSDNLAAAYGFAVTGTMLTTSVLAFAVLPRGSTGAKRMLWLVALGLLLLFDVLLFSANVFKIHEGGWLPLVVAIVVFTLMMTWRRGRRLLSEMQQRDRQPLKEFMEQLEEYPPSRVHGTAIFMTMNSGNVPPALLHNLKHNKVLHDHVLFLTILVADVPYVSEDERFTVNKLSASSWQATVHYGFKEDPDVPDTLRQVAEAYRKSTWNRCVPRTSCRARPWSRPRSQPCGAGAAWCSPSWRATPPAAPSSSRSRPTASWKWACRSSCSRASPTKAPRHAEGLFLEPLSHPISIALSDAPNPRRNIRGTPIEVARSRLCRSAATPLRKRVALRGGFHPARSRLCRSAATPWGSAKRSGAYFSSFS